MATSQAGVGPSEAVWERVRDLLATYPALPLAARLRLLTRHDAVYASYSAQVRAAERLASLPPLTTFPTTG